MKNQDGKCFRLHTWLHPPPPCKGICKYPPLRIVDLTVSCEEAIVAHLLLRNDTNKRIRNIRNVKNAPIIQNTQTVRVGMTGVRSVGDIQNVSEARSVRDVENVSGLHHGVDNDTR